MGWTQSSPQHSPRAFAWCFAAAAAAAAGGVVVVVVVDLTSQHPGEKKHIFHVCFVVRIVMRKSLKSRKFKFNLQGTSLESI